MIRELIQSNNRCHEFRAPPCLPTRGTRTRVLTGAAVDQQTLSSNTYRRLMCHGKETRLLAPGASLAVVAVLQKVAQIERRMVLHARVLVVLQASR